MRRSVGVVLAAVCCSSIGCWAPYEPGAILASPDGAQSPYARTTGCVDVHVQPLAPAPAQSPSALGLGLRFGNRCAAPVEVDFHEVYVIADFDDGTQVTLEPVSTAQGAVDDDVALPLQTVAIEPGALRGELDAHREGRQILVFAPEGLGGSSVHRPIARACVDVSGVELGVEGHLTPICFDLASGAGRASGPSTFDDMTTGGLDFWRRAPAIALAIGLSTHRLGLAGRSMTGGDAVGAPSSVPADPLGSIQAETFDTDFRWNVAGPLYLGAELGIGGGAIARSARLAPGLAVDGGGAFFDAGGLIGVSTPPLGRFMARAELFAGGWVMSTSLADSPNPDGCSDGPCTDIGAWWLEGRVHGEGWLTPWLSLGAWGGAGLLQTGDWSGGISFGMHARSYDGR